MYPTRLGIYWNISGLPSEIFLNSPEIPITFRPSGRMDTGLRRTALPADALIDRVLSRNRPSAEFEDAPKPFRASPVFTAAAILSAPPVRIDSSVGKVDVLVGFPPFFAGSSPTVVLHRHRPPPAVGEPLSCGFQYI